MGIEVIDSEFMNTESVKNRASKMDNTPPKKSDEVCEKMKGRIVNLLVPGNLLLGTKLGEWYEKNPYHKYNEWDILILKDSNIAGYGIRPVAIVSGYEVKKEGSRNVWRYNIAIHSDSDGNFHQWMSKNTVPQGITREYREQEEHFKWNIENHFVKVPVDTAEEALALYKSQEV